MAADRRTNRWLTWITVLTIVATVGIGYSQIASKAAVRKTRRNRDYKLLPAKQEAGDSVTIRGRVLKPDGQPFGGVRIQIVRYFANNWVDRPPLATGVTDAAGKFELTYKKAEIAAGPSQSTRQPEILIAATAEGYGLQWTTWKAIDASNPLIFNLAPLIPIGGQTVDSEEEPRCRPRKNSFKCRNGGISDHGTTP
jgi:hypothetical protein